MSRLKLWYFLIELAFQHSVRSTDIIYCINRVFSDRFNGLSRRKARGIRRWGVFLNLLTNTFILQCSRTVRCLSSWAFSLNHVSKISHWTHCCKAALYFTMRVTNTLQYDITSWPTSVQWVIDTISHDKKDSVVKEKQLEALKRLGHTELKLNEYERTLCSAVLKPLAFIGHSR